jgi:hypothetical protein
MHTRVFFVLAKFLPFLDKENLGNWGIFSFSSVISTNFANFLVKFQQNLNIKNIKKNQKLMHTLF